MSTIRGGKQIIIASLVLVLGAAIFLNWRFSGVNDTGVAGAAKVSSTKVSSTNDKKASINASSKNNQKADTGTSAGNYFSTARLAREQTDAQADDLLSTLVSNTALTTAEQQSAESEIEAINDNAANEGTIESSVKEKGFEDCVAYINNGIVNVVVKLKSGYTLSDSDVEQIEGIVTQRAQASADNIFIITQPQ
jgi:stage III sporulation protein AH